jgi:hypothetical protein
MISAKKIGIWMNHSIAYIMEFTAGLVITRIVDATIDKKETKMDHLTNETASIFKAQSDKKAYYKQLEDSLEDSKEVILFGPTYAKVELYNRLKIDTRFKKTKFKIIHAENLDETQQQEFVASHFSNQRMII